MFATLAIRLPSMHTGGALHVSHRGATNVLFGNPGGEAGLKYAAAAFYADCEHELKPIESGHRLVLLYNLVALAPADKSSSSSSVAALLAEPEAAEDSAPAHHSEKVRLAGTLPCADDSGPLGKLRAAVHSWEVELKNGRNRTPVGSKLVLALGHEYTAQSFGFDKLKGRDAKVAQLLRTAAASTYTSRSWKSASTGPRPATIVMTTILTITVTMTTGKMPRWKMFTTRPSRW